MEIEKNSEEVKNEKDVKKDRGRNDSGRHVGNYICKKRGLEYYLLRTSTSEENYNVILQL